MPPTDALSLGVSQCLLGAGVRYDGGNKANSFVLGLLAPHFNLVAVCPEVEAGMGIPRETVQLQAANEGLRMVGTESGTDHTVALSEFAIRRTEDLAEANLCGYIFKAGSPSCGLDVAVQGGNVATRAEGIFAGAVRAAFPDLPVIEESDLDDAPQREGFVERVFAYSRLARFFSKERSVGQLAMAHAQARFQLDAHNATAAAEIQELFKQANEISYEELCDRYRQRFMEALREPATVTRHFEVLKQIFTEIKPTLTPQETKELARGLQDYRLGTVPLSVPITLLRHHVRVKDNAHLNGHTYLEPEPRELLLRIQV